MFLSKSELVLITPNHHHGQEHAFIIGIIVQREGGGIKPFRSTGLVT